MKLAIFCVLVVLAKKCSLVSVKFENQCPHDIWISKYEHIGWTGAPKQIDNIKILQGSDGTYQFPDASWTGVFTVKYFCDNITNYCRVGSDTLEWPYTKSTNRDFILPVASTKVWFQSRPTGYLGTPLVDYFIDINYGFSVSVSVTPGKVMTRYPPWTYCKPLVFNAFPCPTHAKMTGVNLTSELEKFTLEYPYNKEQCLSPCAQVFYPGIVNEYLSDHGLVDSAAQSYCCNDFKTTCKLNGTDYMHTLRLSGSSTLNNNDLYFATMALCDTSTFTVVVSCTQTAPSPAATPSNETFLFY